MRELRGVWRSVPATVLPQQLGELPLAVEWKRQAPRFWSALTALPESSIFKQAAIYDLTAAQQSNIQYWSAGLLAFAKRHGMALTAADCSEAPLGSHSLPVETGGDRQAGPLLHIL